jgi:DMSO/TMAO reductase YedYZ molybdopterin-dependent catalytic subunit
MSTPPEETRISECALNNEPQSPAHAAIDEARSPERAKSDEVPILEHMIVDETPSPERAKSDEAPIIEHMIFAETASPERTPPGAPPALSGEPPEAGLRRLSRRGFAVAGAAALAGVAGWRWLVTSSEEDGLPWPFRRVLGFNERLARAAFRMSRLAAEFPRSAARAPRVNGQIGIDQALDLAAWKLRVIGPSGEHGARFFDLTEIKALPRVEMTTELKCIEGWSTVVHWAGARLADLAASTGLATRSGRPDDRASLVRYAALETPDANYYVGLDMASALHPQTLLCYELDGRPLALDHGAPLRLVIPVKYGIKNLKQIGTIRFTDERPADYWAERGYDWYAGH